MRLVLVLTLAASLAQVFPSCSGQPGDSIAVIGWVEAKFRDRAEGTFVVVINGHDYNVPEVFWQRVQVGDLVKWDGYTWTIVRRAGATPTPQPTVTR